ncbi:DUF2334 domain-containing protein [Heyndrickxia oleronia]|uniref:DUF2334 domain-containing protein n=1 Tax=Heyndrickxia oleronia TaxID=38875 RepID=UPI00333720AD
MNYKRLMSIFVLAMLVQLIAIVPTTHAEETLPKMTFIYMTQDHLPNSDVLFLEATLAAFAKKIDLVEANQVNIDKLKKSDVIVFMGEEKGRVPRNVRDAIQSFKGRIIAIGHNVEQLQPYKQWKFVGPESIRKLDNDSLETILSIIHVIPPEESEILSTGENLGERFPFIVKKGKLSYIAATAFRTETKYSVSQSLYSLLDQKPPDVHQAYIRLEDISPITDPKLLKETGEYLSEHNIPFYMAVIPVYVNSETGEYTTLASNKKLVRVLKELQKRGGMIIAHGYTHSYRHEETGEGFEFWDAKLNQKIITKNTDETPPKMKNSLDFTSEEEYQKYLNKMNRLEKEYIDEKLTNSIEHLTQLGLYPIAFEAPHYAMSPNGYHVTSEYFSSIFGQVQLSDENWEVMSAPLFASKPAITSGMTLYPETIGFIDPTLSDPYQEMETKLKQLEKVPGSMIGGFYHPYIGLKYLPHMVELIESVPNVEWLDLRKTEQTVQSDHVKIKQEKDKPIQVTSSINGYKLFFQNIKERPFDLVLWVLAIIVSLTILVFFFYILGLRARLRKRLFEERN